MGIPLLKKQTIHMLHLVAADLAADVDAAVDERRHEAGLANHATVVARDLVLLGVGADPGLEVAVRLGEHVLERRALAV